MQRQCTLLTGYTKLARIDPPCRLHHHACARYHCRQIHPPCTNNTIAGNAWRGEAAEATHAAIQLLPQFRPLPATGALRATHEPLTRAAHAHVRVCPYQASLSPRCLLIPTAACAPAGSQAPYFATIPASGRRRMMPPPSLIQ
jgi:hypothetical protein